MSSAKKKKSVPAAHTDLRVATECLINAADGLISAIEGTTDQFEPEVALLSEAASAAEKALDRTGTVKASPEELLDALERAHVCLDRIADRLLLEEGQSVTFLYADDIRATYDDAICELAPIEALIRTARGAA